MRKNIWTKIFHTFNFLQEPVIEEISEFVEVRKNGVLVAMEDLDPMEQQMIEITKSYDHKFKVTRDSMEKKENPTSEDRFDNYCTDMNRKEMEKILKSQNITLGTDSDSSSDYDDYEASGEVVYENYDVYQDTVVVRKDDIEEVEDEEMTDIEAIARIGDRTLLAEKIDVEEGEELETVNELINSFEVSGNGKVEKVFQIDSKKGLPVLLIQFDSPEYRDAVLKSSRLPEAR